MGALLGKSVYVKMFLTINFLDDHEVVGFLFTNDIFVTSVFLQVLSIVS